MGQGWRARTAIVFCALWSAAAGAQELPAGAGEPPLPPPPTFQIPPGAKVRLGSRAMPGGLVQGRVTSSTDEALGLMIASDDSPFGGGQLVVPRESVTSLQVSLGYKRYTLVGALFGAIAGAAGGAAATVDTATCDSWSSDTYCSRAEAIAVSAGAGALLGALVGHFVKTERWQNVSVEVLAPRSTAGRPVARGRGGAVAARVAFRF
jgi:hypothetical protein